MERLTEEDIALALILRAPLAKLETWRAKRSSDHRSVSSFDTTYHDDWGWTRVDEKGQEGQLPSYCYYLLKDGTPHLTCMTTARGAEAVLPAAHMMDRSAYGRQQDWEDSPDGWPQLPTSA